MGLREISRFSIHPLDRLSQYSIDPIEGIVRIREWLASMQDASAASGPADGTTSGSGDTTSSPVADAGDVIRWGKITSTSPLEVQFTADTAGVPVGGTIGPYTPVLHDVVVLLRVGVQWGIVGDWSPA